MALKYQRMRKSQLPNGELNITSLMDILTTLIFFIVLLAGFNNFFEIPANPLSMGRSTTTQKKAAFTLEVTVEKPTVLKIWLGPINGLNITNGSRLRNFLRRNFRGNDAVGFTRIVENRNPKVALQSMQKLLIQIKKGFPNKYRAVVAFDGGISYQTMINAISAVRSYRDRSATPEPDSGTSRMPSSTTANNQFAEQGIALFPEVVISEWSKGK